MPRICAFYGISIWMYHDEARHPGRPHFHVTYASSEASIDIADLDVLAGAAESRAAARGGVGASAP